MKWKLLFNKREKLDKSEKKARAKLRGKEKMTRREILLSWARAVAVIMALAIVVIFCSIMFLDDFTRHGERHELPSFSDMTVAEATASSGDMNLRFEVSDSLYVDGAAPGVILDQRPKGGSYVKSGRRVTVTINTTAPRSVELPYVTGYSLRQAQNRLLAASINIKRLVYVEDIAANNIVKQEYNNKVVGAKSNMVVPIFSEVILYVGRGVNPPLLLAPMVVGEELNAAENMLHKDGINVSIERDSTITDNSLWNCYVYRQYPVPADTIDYGIDMKLFVTKDISVVKRYKQLFLFYDKKIDSLTVEVERQSKIFNEIMESGLPAYVVGIPVATTNNVGYADDFITEEEANYIQVEQYMSTKFMLDSISQAKRSLFENGIITESNDLNKVEFL